MLVPFYIFGMLSCGRLVKGWRKSTRQSFKYSSIKRLESQCSFPLISMLMNSQKHLCHGEVRYFVSFCNVRCNEAIHSLFLPRSPLSGSCACKLCSRAGICLVDAIQNLATSHISHLFACSREIACPSRQCRCCILECLSLHTSSITLQLTSLYTSDIENRY